ncbi:hypothetical protein DNK59_08405 [Pseudomonas sp. TKO26]|uniref:DUF6388 family protein n=1 Tax=unclassified Pseudomonas TaxID=196821 RepID=UPI000D965A94|nr:MULTISPECIES: DUF6388 family protein [unclassified Pseudomonas]PYY88716.1 hypothetical protein DNK62_08405 [Pseudomonas sp. TKO30]PYY91577.1 hypothetical protein DNK61_08405 [Pseudomonas sp. TKO29]PYY94231.1 hypothetical protein DNK59_08405 [Pseudomonas sp. TKO26]PYZ00946.1 hypothetical protein DNK60_08405 [Pseudomonas sp. TKO14]
MQMSELSYQQALMLYLAERPELVAQLGLGQPSGLHWRPEDLSELQIQHASRLFDEEARLRGMGTWELALSFIARTPQELSRMTLEAHREIAEMVDMDWDQYCQLNHLRC